MSRTAFFSHREQLRAKMEEYILDTQKYINTVKDFCDKRNGRWVYKRESELKIMRDISFNYVTISKSKVKTFMEELKKGRIELQISSKVKKLEKELGSVLQDTLKGLDELQPFLEAVEKLAVTSLLVFKEHSFLPKVISKARELCPLLIHFKRDARKFFHPSLCNVDVLMCYLEKYLEVTQKLSEGMKKTYDGVVLECKKSEESMQKLYKHIRQLSKIRMDESFRLVFLFEQNAQDFMDLFEKHHDRMFKFLKDLEENASKLDNMKKGSSISMVAGSSVSIISGVLSISGLALAPVTAGVSLSLTLAGVGLGITSGINSLVTCITEMAVKYHHRKNAKSIFDSFMEDMQMFQGTLDKAASRKHPEELQRGFNDDAGKIFNKARSLHGKINAMQKINAAPALKSLKNKELPMKVANLGLQKSKCILAKDAPLALPKVARAGIFSLISNSFSIGLDVASICKASRSLAKGKKSKASKAICSRSALWRTELEALEKINKGLCQGIREFSKWKKILE